MADNLQLKYSLKQRVDQYNKDQKSLFVHSYILKIVTILCLIVFIVIIGFFLVPIATPLLLKRGVYSDVMALMFSSCTASLLIFGLVIFFFKQRFKQKIVQSKQIYSNTVSTDDKESDLSVDPDNIKAQDEFDIKMSPNTKKHKKTFFASRLFNLFAIIKDFFSLIISIFLSPVKQPEKLYLDENKLNFACSLINELQSQKNCAINYELVVNKYPGFSNTWLNNTLEVLSKINVIKLTTIEPNNRVILLNLD